MLSVALDMPMEHLAWRSAARISGLLLHCYYALQQDHVLGPCGTLGLPDLDIEVAAMGPEVMCQKASSIESKT